MHLHFKVLKVLFRAERKAWATYPEGPVSFHAMFDQPCLQDGGSFSKSWKASHYDMEFWQESSFMGGL